MFSRLCFENTVNKRHNWHYSRRLAWNLIVDLRNVRIRVDGIFARMIVQLNKEPNVSTDTRWIPNTNWENERAWYPKSGDGTGPPAFYRDLRRPVAHSAPYKLDTRLNSCRNKLTRLRCMTVYVHRWLCGSARLYKTEYVFNGAMSSEHCVKIFFYFIITNDNVKKLTSISPPLYKIYNR